jgi:hypothetical protein
MSLPSFPREVPQLPSAASLRRVPWARFPNFLGTISRLRLLVPPPASLRCLRSAVPRYTLHSLQRRERPRHRPGLFLRRRPQRLLHEESTRAPRFLGDPSSACRCSSTPAERSRQAVQREHCCLSPRKRLRLREKFHFEALLRRLQTPCVRFAVAVARAPRNTRFRPVANLCRYRNLTCRVPPEGFCHVASSTWLPPSPGFAWRTLRGNFSRNSVRKRRQVDRAGAV